MRLFTRLTFVSLAFEMGALHANPAMALLIAASYEGLFSTTQSYRDLANAEKDTWEELAAGWDRVSNHEVTLVMGTADLGTNTLALT
jgi:hypothetical protein